MLAAIVAAAALVRVTALVSRRGPSSNVSARVPGHHLQVIKPLRLVWLCV
jgi:hypothetical protein